MLLEILLAVPLRSRLTPAPRPPFLEGLASFLLEGSFRPPVHEALADAGAVIARLHRSVKAVDPAARAFAADGAVDVFESRATEAPGPELEVVPPAWSDGLLTGAAHVSLRRDQLAASLTARFSSRTRGAAPALRLVLRGVRADLLPNDGGADDTYRQDLGKALRRPGAFRDLQSWLVQDGEALARAISTPFAELCDAPIERKLRVRLFDRAAGAEDLLRGLPPGVALHVETTSAWFRALRPAVTVSRHRWDGGVELWRGEVTDG